MKTRNALRRPRNEPAQPVGPVQDLARWLQRKSERLTSRTRIILWFGACLLTGGYYSMTLYEALSGRAVAWFTLAPIRLPPHIGKTDTVNRQSRISTYEYRQVLRLRHYLDSLSRLPDTTVHHRFSRQHPGLEDSLDITIQLYLKQKGLD